MKRVSPKRAALMKEAGPWRKALKERVGRCEHCLKPRAPEFLDCDEISRGCDRGKSLMEECAILVVCRPCHAIVQDWPRAKRLALLYLTRSGSYDLERFWQITGRRWPDQEEVDVHIKELFAEFGYRRVGP